MDNFEFQIQTKVYFGLNTIQQVGEIVKAMNGKKTLVVEDPIVKKTGAIDAIYPSLQTAGIAYEIFTQGEPEPSVEIVEQGCAVLKAGGYDTILAVGGGSVMDAAKGIAILAANPGRIQDYAGWNKFSNRSVPVIAIPTTAGTGSEISDAAVISDKQQNLKLTIKHDLYSRPAVAILDPGVLRTVPRGLAVTTGFDTLAHAVESYTSLMVTPYLEVFSLRSIELANEHLRNFAQDRADTTAGGGMLLASNMAGISFPIAGTGNCHCIARFVGNKYHIPHGMCCSIILPHVMEFNYQHAQEKYRKIAIALGEDVHGLSLEEAAYRGVVGAKKLAKDLGLPATVREYKPEIAVDVEWVADECSKTWYNKYNPRFTTKEDFVQLVKEIAG